MPPSDFNNQYALPDKLFEFIQGRLAVAIGPLSEMAALVRQYGCGVIAGDFSPRTFGARLNALDHHRIDHYKQRSHPAAKDLCFEQNTPVLLEMIERQIGIA